MQKNNRYKLTINNNTEGGSPPPKLLVGIYFKISKDLADTISEGRLFHSLFVLGK